jgi:hypothetical protein
MPSSRLPQSRASLFGSRLPSGAERCPSARRVEPTGGMFKKENIPINFLDLDGRDQPPLAVAAVDAQR